MSDTEARRETSTSRAVDEYEACIEYMQSASTRRWQSLTVVGAAYAAVLFTFVNVIPDDFYAVWIKISLGWITIVGLTGLNFVAGSNALHELYWEQVAFRRAMQIEKTLKFQLITQGYVLLRRAWRVDTREWKTLPARDRKQIEKDYKSGLYGLVPPTDKPRYSLLLVMIVILFQILLVVSGILLTVFLA